MKRMMRITALVLSIAALCLSLCSCQYLDEARANTAVYTDDSMNSLTFRGKLYKSVKLPSGLSFITTETEIGRYAVTPDVPVLLNGSFGDAMYYDLTGMKDDSAESAPTFVCVHRYEHRFDTRVEAAVMEGIIEYLPAEQDFSITEQYYVREDAYDRAKRAADEANLDHYFATVYEFDDITVPWQGGRYVPTMLDDETAAVITRTMNGGAAASWSELPDAEWHVVYINRCDKEMLLTDNNSSIALLTDGSRYYLFTTDNVAKLYQFADGDSGLIRKVFSLYDNNTENIDIQYYRENADKISNTSSESES